MIHAIFNKKGYGKEYFMNKEIKEILDNIEASYETTENNSFIKFKWLDYKQILNYITNLQEENERKERLITQYGEGMCAYANRIDKAIEYIQKEFCQVNKETKELECWHERVKPILDILKGVNNE